jgi:hypothetical protein
MTEADWLACASPRPMLAYLRKEAKVTRTKGGRRRLRLFGCACCRRAWDALQGLASRGAVEQAERYADGSLEEAAWRVAWVTVARAYAGAPRQAKPAANAVSLVTDRKAWLAAGAWWHTSGKLATRLVGTTPEQEQAAQADLVRDIFANPFRPLPSRTFPAHAVGLARSCYEAFPAVSEDYPVLADALDELGEETAAAHCRQAAHAKGCYVIDWVLGRV